MASGKAHHMATLTLTPAVAAAAYHYTGGNGFYTALAGLGCLLNILINPDRDLRVQSSDFKLARYTAGLGLLWPMFWWVYSSLIPRHRHWLSHFPVVGTTGRVLYLAAWLSPLLFYLWPIPALYPAGAYAFAALCVADTAHWLMDGMPL